MAVEFSGTDVEFRDDVRAAVGGVSEDYLPDDVIEVNRNRTVIPFIERNIDESKHDQSDIDNAIVMYTADRAFNSPQLKSTVSGGGLTTNYATKQHRNELRQRASEALAAIGLAPPSDGAVPFSASTDGFLR